MQRPKLPIIGATEAQVKFLQQIAWENFHIISLPAWEQLDLLSSEDISLILFCGNSNPQYSTTKLQQLLACYPYHPVVWMPSQADKYAVVEAYDLGVKKVLLPPCTKNQLSKCIQQYARPVSKKNNQPGRDLVINQPFWNWLNSLLSKQIGIVPKPLTSEQSRQQLPLSADLNVQFFGTFQLFQKDRPLSDDLNRRSKAILAYLILHRKHPHIRTRIIRKFWPDYPKDAAKNLLCVAICSIRKWLEDNGLEKNSLLFRNEKYFFHPDLIIDTDYDHFLTNWKQSESSAGTLPDDHTFTLYHRAFAFYRGDFMENIEGVDWVESTREKLQGTYIRLLDRIGAAFMQKQEFQICIEINKRILEIDDCLEEAHRRIMRCYGYLGLRAKVIEQFQACKKALEKGLQRGPSKQTLELFHQIMGEDSFE